MKLIVNKPVFNFLFFSYVLNATWEWTQSPFFIDVTSNLNMIIWYRIHCSLGDTLILLTGFALVSLIHKGIQWVYHPKTGDYLILILFVFFYTLFSEYLNVYVRHAWSYSQYMPLMPFTHIGIVPLIQWIILPPTILFITRRQISS